MPFYTLKEGQACAHNGRDLVPGQVIQLPVHVGRELSGKLVPCTKDGEPLGMTGIDLQIAQAAEHERPSLEAEKAALAKPAPAVATETKVVEPVPGPKVTTVRAPFARPVEPNMEVGKDQGPDPIHVAPPKTT